MVFLRKNVMDLVRNIGDDSKRWLWGDVGGCDYIRKRNVRVDYCTVDSLLILMINSKNWNILNLLIKEFSG